MKEIDPPSNTVPSFGFVRHLDPRTFRLAIANRYFVRMESMNLPPTRIRNDRTPLGTQKCEKRLGGKEKLLQFPLVAPQYKLSI